jgi:hypothetical protein
MLTASQPRLTTKPASPAHSAKPYSRSSHKQSAKSDPLTPSFSANRFHSSSLFHTLFPLSPVFATLTKSTSGVAPYPEFPMGFFPICARRSMPHSHFGTHFTFSIRLTTPPPTPKMNWSQPSQRVENLLLKTYD